MKKNKTTWVMVLFFFIGLSILFYPTISNIYNSRVQSKAIVDYEAILKNYDENKYKEFFERASDYNVKLKKLVSPFTSHTTIKNYNNILNIDGTGMMGYITIDKIRVELPIYHGTSNKVLSKAVGHIEGSTLPIGGVGTHSVLSAHRGLPSSVLFTNLDKLELGDIFVITILDRELTYEVENIVIVNPDEIDNLKINEEEDYVTLVTCTPYGINTHRLLVRGRRIANEKKRLYITTEAYKISNLIVTSLVGILIIFILLLIVLFKPIDNVKIDINKLKEKDLEVKDNDN